MPMPMPMPMRAAVRGRIRRVTGASTLAGAASSRIWLTDVSATFGDALDADPGCAQCREVLTYRCGDTGAHFVQ
jgi:hypothetical protein